MKATVTRYPNNEVRVAVFPERLPKDYFRAEFDLDDDGSSTSVPVSLNPSDSVLSSSEIGSNPLLDIKSKVDTVPRRLHMALSRYGRRQVLRAGSCFDMGEDTERLLLTGTLPGSTLKAFQALAEFSTYATKTLCNWLTKHEPGCKWMYCWEFQGRGALHIHLICEVGSVASEFIKAHFKDEWDRIIREIGRRADTNLYQKTSTYANTKEALQADVTVCDREPSRYISKYISKSSTSAKSFARFPPRQWFQVSRSLLKALREKTQVFSIEGLTYRGALGFIEQATSCLANHTLSGWQRFSGSVLAWSGYGYSELFSIEEWSGKFMKKNQSLLATTTMCAMTRRVIQKYPIARAGMIVVAHSGTLELMEKGMLSETELLLYIETAMRLLAREVMTSDKPMEAATQLRTANLWWEAKFGYQAIDSETLDVVNKICDGTLTKFEPRTKVETRYEQLSIYARPEPI